MVTFALERPMVKFCTKRRINLNKIDRLCERRINLNKIDTGSVVVCKSKYLCINVKMTRYNVTVMN